jgi:hypothetical protein
MLDPDGPGHGIGFLGLRNPVFVEPDVFGLLAFGEEEEVGADGGVGFEDAVGQADDGVEVAFLHQVFLEPGLHAFAKEGAVRQDHRRPAAGFEQADDEGEEQVGGFAGLEMLGEVGFDAILLAAAEGRVGEDDVHTIAGGVAESR